MLIVRQCICRYSFVFWTSFCFWCIHMPSYIFLSFIFFQGNSYLQCYICEDTALWNERFYVRRLWKIRSATKRTKVTKCALGDHSHKFRHWNMHVKHMEKMLMSIPEAKVCLHKTFLEEFQTENIFLKNSCLFAKEHLLSLVNVEHFSFMREYWCGAVVSGFAMKFSQ